VNKLRTLGLELATLLDLLAAFDAVQVFGRRVWG
jgi:hypothetical protein